MNRNNTRVIRVLGKIPPSPKRRKKYRREKIALCNKDTNICVYKARPITLKLCEFIAGGEMLICPKEMWGKKRYCEHRKKATVLIPE